MRGLVAAAVLIAVLAMVLVTVRQHGEVRRLESRVWCEMRRRDSLDKQIREVEARLATELSPRALLEELDALRLAAEEETLAWEEAE